MISLLSSPGQPSGAKEAEEMHVYKFGLFTWAELVHSQAETLCRTLDQLFRRLGFKRPYLSTCSGRKSHEAARDAGQRHT